ncbi:MAG: glycosyltransferase family 87 protein [Candidatus Acidiferrum sp.]
MNFINYPEEIATKDASAAIPNASRSNDWHLPRMAQVGLIGILLICALVNARQVAWYWSHGPANSDLKIFMTPLEMMRTGQRQQIHRFDAQEATQNRLYPETRQVGLLPFNHLAYELLFYWPLARLNYRAALVVWSLLNAVLVFLIGWALSPFARRLKKTLGVPLAVWIFAFYPLLFVGQGQDSLVSLLLIVLSLRFAENKRDFLAGLLLGLTLFKVHLALGIGFFVFFVARKWLGLAGFVASAIFVTGISRMMVGPTFWSDYLQIVRQQEVVTPWGFIPWFMPNLRGILEWTLARWLHIGSILPILFVVSLVVVGVTWIALRVPRVVSERNFYSGAIAATLLVSYHLHLQDLTLAILPALILLNACVERKLSVGWSWVLILAIGMLYLYGPASAVFPFLRLHGALLVFPVIFLWLVAIWEPSSAERYKQQTELAGNV